jgi:methionyl-tRNA formyltransferase
MTNKIIYAANRAIGVQGIALLYEAGFDIVGLLVPAAPAGSHNAEMERAAPGVPVLEVKDLRDRSAIERLKSIPCDYLLSVHFPYLFPPAVLAVPTSGTLNIHPAFLPFNRGWHTATWAILENTPIGATLHWVDEGVDSGDVALQRRVDVRPDDTGDKLYKRVLEAEIELLREALPLLKSGKLPRTPQDGQGTFHRKSDVQSVRRLELTRNGPVFATIDLLRALTTSDSSEAAYFEMAGKKYSIRIDIREE